MNIAYSILAKAASETVSSPADGVVKEILARPDAADQINHPDYWGSVGIIALTGILVVFLILAILIFVFWLMGTIFKSIGNKKKADVPADKPAPVVQAAAPAAPAAEADDEDDDEVIAVISAAIAAYSAADGVSYRITDIKRRDGRARSAWSLAGINENTRPFEG